MTRPTVYGPTYSVYTRIARPALEEKGVPYDLVEVAMLSGAHKQPDFLLRNLFGKLPAFAHDALSLYETGAITRYVDRAFAGPALQPAEPNALARVDQVISIVDFFAYDCMVGVLAWQRLVVPMLKEAPGEPAIAACLPQVKLCVGAHAPARRPLALVRRCRHQPCGPACCAGDGLCQRHAQGADLIAAQPALASWWERMSERPSMAGTQPQFG